MVVSNPSLAWERLDNVYYQLNVCYEYKQSLNLHDYRTAVSQNATAIALYPTDQRLAANESSSSSVTNKFMVFSGSGILLYEIPWDDRKNGKVMGFHWSLNEHLIVISSYGFYREYYDFDDNFHEVFIDVLKYDIKDCKFFQRPHQNDSHTKIDGFILFLQDGKTFVKKYLDRSDFEIIENFNQQETIKQWHLGVDEEILISTATAALQKLNYFEDLLSSDTSSSLKGVVKHLKISPNRQLVTFWLANNVYIMTADFQKLLNKVPIDSQITDLNWSSNDVVGATITNDELRIIGPGQQTLSFFYNSDKILTIGEQDGLRILSDDKLEFFTKVDDSSLQIFKIGSTLPASIILDSLDLYNSENSTNKIMALENLKSLNQSNNLLDAIMVCINASKYQFDPFWQKKLLKAANFAKQEIIDTFPSNILSGFITDFKTLNALRDSSVGCFYTYQEFKKYSKDSLSFILKNILLKRHYYLLCVKICEFLKLPMDSIYISWCCNKIKHFQGDDDSELFQILYNKFHSVPNMSVIQIAETAYQEGRPTVCNSVLDYEPSVHRQVSLLLKIEESELAIEKCESRMDYKLIEYVLLFLQDRLKFSKFLQILSNRKISLRYWENMMKQLNNWYFLKNYYSSFDKRFSIANLNLLLSSCGKTEADLNNANTGNDFNTISEINIFANKKKSMYNTIRIYENFIKNNSSAKKKFQEDLVLLKKELKLIEFQELLSKTLPNLNFTNKSLIETLETLILANNYDDINNNNNMEKIIEKLLKEFKISEKRYYYVVIDKLSNADKWTELYSFATRNGSVKSPVGYLVFYQSCIKYNAIRQAGIYINLIGSNEPVTYKSKVKMYLKVGNYKSAVELCTKYKDTKLLNRINAVYNR